MIVELAGLTFFSEQERLAGQNVKFKLTDLNGWYSSPPVTVDIVNMPGADGAFNPVRGYRGAKSISLEGVCWASDAQTAIRDAWKALAGLATGGERMTMTVTDDDGQLQQDVWLSGAPQVEPFGPTRARFMVPLVATDPRKYAAQDPQVAMAAAQAPDGLRFPLFESGYLDFGPYSPTGVFYLTNEGTAESWPTFTAVGYIDSLGFQILSGTQVLKYEASVAAGETVTLSPYAGGRAYNGSVDVTGNLSQSDWPSVKPGETRMFVFNLPGTNADEGAHVETNFGDAWW